MVPVLVDGRPLSALVDSGCSVSLIAAKGVAGRKTVAHGPELRLETMTGQRFKTHGWVELRSLCSANMELGPVRAYVVPTLPFGVDVVIGLPLLLRHGCWFGKVHDKVMVRWGANTMLATTAKLADKVTDTVTDMVTANMVSAPVPGRRLRPGGGALSADMVTDSVMDMVSAPVPGRRIRPGGGALSADMVTDTVVDTVVDMVTDTVTDMVSAPVPGRRIRPGGGALSADMVTDTVVDTVTVIDTEVHGTAAGSTVVPRLADTAGALVDDKDFRAEFHDGKWTVRWKWKTGIEPLMELRRLNYSIVEEDREAFDTEVSAWIDEGILVKYDQMAHGKIQRFLPMMGIRQEKGDKCKIRPVFDYRQLNKTVESHPGGATPLCAVRLREWRQRGANCAVLDLRKAYLQVHVDPSLWVHQAVWWHGNVYLLTRLGFGLTSAPKIMTAIVEWITAVNPTIHGAVSSYIDDLFVAEDQVGAEIVKDHLQNWGLESKEPERLGSTAGVRVLGLRVNDKLRWSRDRQLPVVGEHPLTRRQVHSVLGEWIGHFPVAGWLRVACGFLQRCTASDNIKWDAQVSAYTMSRLRDAAAMIQTQGDPVKGRWLVNPDAHINIWVDASSIALGVALEIDGNIVEDAAWLRPKGDSAHINRSELDAAIRGINMALLWGRRKLTLITDSATVYGWLQAVINKTHNVKTRALSEVLIRRRLDTVREVVAEENLDISVRWVRSADNLADKLTRVPSKWLRMQINGGLATVVANVDTELGSPSLQDVREIHDRCHFGVDRTLELARERFGDGVSRKMVKKIVSRCDRCARVDPSVAFRWDRGVVAASRVWQRWATDITHVDGRPYLSVTDTVSGFTMWRALRNESAHEVCGHIRQLFSEFGPPESLMSDNGTVFRSKDMGSLLRNWEVSQELACAYRSQGNGIAERAHRTIKRTAKRLNGTVEEAVFWVNNTCGERVASPYELVFGARSRKPGVSAARVEIERPLLPVQTDIAAARYQDCARNPFVVGEEVYLRRPDGRCDREWSGPHRITLLKSSVSVVLDDDGVSRHVSHLRRVPNKVLQQKAISDVSDSDSGDDQVDVGDGENQENDSGDDQVDVGDGENQEEAGGVELRRSTRQRQQPLWYGI
jgi:ribonuclease HI